MRPDARAWFESPTTSVPSLDALDLDALLRAKRRGQHRVSVVLPARDEEATVGGLVADLPGRVPLEIIERHWPDLLPTLVDHPGVGFLLVHSAEFGPVVLGRDGLRRLDSGVVIGDDPLAAYGEHAAALVARYSSFPHCADVVVNSRYDPKTDEASPFEPHVGSHGGLGGPQQHAFVLHPRSFADVGTVVGAEQLHRVLRGWLTDLGHPEPTGNGATVGPLSATALRRSDVGV